MLGCVCSMVWFAAASTIVFAIVTESSEGNDRSPELAATELIDWFGELLSVLRGRRVQRRFPAG